MEYFEAGRLRSRSASRKRLTPLPGLRERPLFHPAQGLTLHQLAQQFDAGEDQGHQALLHRLRVGIDPEPTYRIALIRCDHAILVSRF